MNPRSDTTGAFGPAIQVWAGEGRIRLSGSSTNEYHYFKTYTGQRAWNTTNQFRFEMPSARISPIAEGSYVNAAERSGYEIDARARRIDYGGMLGAALRFSAKTGLEVSVRQQRFAYDRSDEALGVALSDALDRTTNIEQASFRHALTPLTTWVTTGEAIQDEFRVSADKDARSIRVLSGFELKPFALISGRVVFGARRFNVIDARTPDYTGFVAEATARYAVRATAVDVRYNRDVMFSYETDTPYYLLGDLGLAVTQRLTRDWDLVGRGGRQRLDYTRSAATAAADRVDRGTEWGGGVGYRVGHTLRLGFDVNHYRRSAPDAPGHEYDGFRAGGSVTYGLPQ